MPILELTEAELQSLINIVANASVPWVVSNPLLTKIGQQLQAWHAANPDGAATEDGSEECAKT